MELCSLPKFELISCKEDFYNVDTFEEVYFNVGIFEDGDFILSNCTIEGASDFSNDTFVDRYFNVDNFEETISGGVSNSMRIINYFEVILFY